MADYASPVDFEGRPLYPGSVVTYTDALYRMQTGVIVHVSEDGGEICTDASGLLTVMRGQVIENPRRASYGRISAREDPGGMPERVSFSAPEEPYGRLEQAGWIARRLWKRAGS